MRISVDRWPNAYFPEWWATVSWGDSEVIVIAHTRELLTLAIWDAIVDVYAEVCLS